MTKMSLDLSDDLGRLADDFDQFAHGGLVLDSGTVLGLVAKLRALHRRARYLETELSRHLWNDAARRDNARHEMHSLLDVATRPDSNVKLFPIIRRPTPPTGAA